MLGEDLAIQLRLMLTLNVSSVVSNTTSTLMACKV